MVCRKAQVTSNVRQHRMPLTAQLNSPAALYRKLEREAYRAFHGATPLEKTDHFFNFCITASSMRDFCLEHQGLHTKDQRKPAQAAWHRVPLLVAAIEIGNSSKHFVLRDNAGAKKAIATRSARMKKAQVFNIYLNRVGDHKVVAGTRTEISVTLSDGVSLELYQFTKELLEYWRQYLVTIGVKVRSQSFARLSSSAA